MQRQLFKTSRRWPAISASRVGTLLALTSLFALTACESRSTVTENNLEEPRKDGSPPVLTTVTVQPNGVVEEGDSVRIDIESNEAILPPVVFINNAEATVRGGIRNWVATRTMTDAEPEGNVTFTIAYQDASGEIGQAISTTTDGSVACYGPDCVTDELGPLEGNWKLTFAGVGPSAGDTSWFSISDGGLGGARDCWFDDTYEFGADGSFRNVQGDETWVEPWQGTVTAESCAAPVAPHDGSNNAVFEYDETASTLKLTGLGAYLGLSKVINGGELASPADTPESVTYEVVELIGDSLTVRINFGPGFWEFRLNRISNDDIVGKWRLNFAGVGPSAGDTSWFSIADTGPTGPRACWFDDIYLFAGDGTFQNFQGGETWVEPWQGTVTMESCGTPVAPHDGSNVGGWIYDETGGTLSLVGTGSFLGLSKVVNGAELDDPANTPEFVTYEVVELVGDSLTVRINFGPGYWEYRFDRVADTADLAGNWKLDFAGVGPAAGDTSWFSISDGGLGGARDCWFDDAYHFGRDGRFANVQGDETWVEPWQGTVTAESCAAPVAPHDGSNNAIYEYDETAGTLKLTGLGAFVGLAKVINGAELASPADTPDTVTYEVVELIGDALTLRINFGPGYWEYRLSRVSADPVVGNWALTFAGVGPAAGDTSWFSISDTGPTGPRACWFDDVYHFGGDGTFQNFQGGDTWVEPWQGTVMAEGCSTPVAPHDGSSEGGWLLGDSGNSLSLVGTGSHLGLAKVVNGAELDDPANTPENVTYEVVEIVGDSMTVRINFGPGYWEYNFVKR